jgi:hypothetical protein
MPAPNAMPTVNARLAPDVTTSPNGTSGPATTSGGAATKSGPATKSWPNAVPNARPAPGVTPDRDAAPSEASAPARSPAGSHRAPFVVLLCALLGGALVSALVISTTLAEGSFRITNLQQTTNALTRQRQALEEQVAQAQSAQTIETQALRLGMRPAGEIRFIDLKTGKTSNDANTGWQSAINVPGYTP